MMNLIEYNDFVYQIPNETLAWLDGELVIIHTVVDTKDGNCAIHYSPEITPSWKKVTKKHRYDFIKTFVTVNW